jgi:hypothetical protein
MPFSLIFISPLLPPFSLITLAPLLPLPCRRLRAAAAAIAAITPYAIIFDADASARFSISAIRRFSLIIDFSFIYLDAIEFLSMPFSFTDTFSLNYFIISIAIIFTY